MASNVFAHSDKLKEMAECMIKLLKNGVLIIEIQYLLNTLKDLTLIIFIMSIIIIGH